MSKNYIKCISFFVIVIFWSDLLKAQVKCSDYFSARQESGVIERNIKLDQAVVKKRAKSIKRVHLQQLTINNTTYQILGLLGEGSSRVYLGVSSEGLKVVIKHLKETSEVGADWINSIYYEMAVTQYYLSHGLAVPKIIDYEIVKVKNVLKEGFLIKEYREGLTHEEFLELRGLKFLKGERYVKLDEAYEASEQKLNEVHAGFKKWLKANKIDLNQYSFVGLKGLIKYGDFSGQGHQNWIFDLETYQWMLFDP